MMERAPLVSLCFQVQLVEIYLLLVYYTKTKKRTTIVIAQPLLELCILRRKVDQEKKIRKDDFHAVLVYFNLIFDGGGWIESIHLV